MHKRGITVIFILVLIAVGFFRFADVSNPAAKPSLKIEGLTVEIQIADTEIERTAGLAGKLSLPENEGLLLIFDEPGKHGIWMKDMKFSVDILWLDEDFVVIDFKENIPPGAYPEVFTPSVPALYVLEVNAGIADKYDIKIEDKFIYE